ncbi:uncharacterized protein [Amphiura filiformis]|uniref:uncharacterized protein n=1 Tax=Amphiura filiformis TaxID=82378 RepID=UPI003B2212D1
MAPMEIDLQDSLESFQLRFEADDIAAFANIKALFQQSPNVADMVILELRSSAYETYDTWVISGHLSEAFDNEIFFDVNKIPAISLQMRLFPMIGNAILPTPDGMGFVFTFYAMPPILQSLAFDSSGSYLIVRFEPGVNYKDLKRCDYIFEATSNLGVSQRCKWVGPHQLHITIGIDDGNGLIEVGDSMALRENTITTFGEEFSRKASGSLTVSAPDNYILPVAHIQGNRMISSCGMLRLSARGSTGGGGRNMAYQWSVCSGPGDYQSISFSSPDPRDIIIEGTNLLADQYYGICLEVSNFLTRGPQDVIKEVVTVRRSSADEPEVVIISPDVNIIVSKSFTLAAEVSFTDCFTPTAVNFEWFVDDDSIPLNLKTRTTPGLFVEKQTLQGDRDVTFTVRVSQSSDAASFVERSITISTRYSDLQAIIDKSSEFTIGRLSGDLALDASRSIDPDNIPLAMRYRWRCLQVTDNTPCFVKGGTGETFPSSEDSERDVIVLDPELMFSDVSYLISVDVSKGSRKSSTRVLIHVVDGKPPEVIITSDTRAKRNTQKTLQLDAVIKSPGTDVQVIRWQAIQREGFGYAEAQDDSINPSRSFNDGYTSTFRIEKGTLTPGVSYVFRATACRALACGEAVVEVETLPIVTSCVLSIANGNSYTVLDKVTFNVDNCVTSPSAYPLSFQIYRLIDDTGNIETLTKQQTFPGFETIGKPAREGIPENTFIAKVCNAYISCSLFNVTAIVTPRDDLTPETIAQLTDELVEAFKLTKNYLEALVNFNIITDITGSTTARRRKRAVTVSTLTAANQIELVENVLENTVLDYSNAQLLIDQLTSLSIEELSYVDRGRLLSVIYEIVLVFDGEHPIESNSAQIILDITGVIAEDMIPEQLSLISTINSMLITSQVTVLTLGADAVQTSSDYVTSSVQRVFPNGVFRTKAAADGAYVHFGTQIEEIYGPIWSCSGGDACSGVVIHYEHYRSDTDYFSTTEEDRINRAADIIGISLHDPSSDSELDITGLTTPITINITITRPQTNKSYECRYWSVSDTAWLSDGIDTVIQTTTLVTCLTHHLTQFTVMGVDLPITTESMGSTELPGSQQEQRKGLTAGLTTLVVLVILFVIVAIVIVIAIVYKKSKKTKIVPVYDEPEVNDQNLEEHDQSRSRSPTAPPLLPPTPDDLPHGNSFEPQNETPAAMTSSNSSMDDGLGTRDSPRLDQSIQPTAPPHPNRFNHTSTPSSDSTTEPTDPEQDMGDSPPLYPPLKLYIPIRQRLSTLSTESSMTLPDLEENIWESPPLYENNQTPIPENQEAPLNKARAWTSQSSSSFDEANSLGASFSTNSSNPRTSRLRSESLASTIDPATPPLINPTGSSNRPKAASKVRTISSNPRTSRVRSESLASTIDSVTPPPINPTRSSNRPNAARKVRTISSNPRTSRLRSESLASTIDSITPPPINPTRSSNRPKAARKVRTALPNISM